MLPKITSVVSALLLSTILFAQDNSDNAYLGVTYHHVSEEKAEKLNFETTQGAFVTAITEGSAAQASGIQAFDYIVAMNDQDFTPDKSFSSAMKGFQPGEGVEITVVRKGKEQKLKAQLTTRPENSKDLYEDSNAFLGVYPSHDEVPEEMIGSRISTVTDGTTAELIGMRGDDIILSINDNTIVDWTDVGTALDNTPTGDDLNVVFYRESSGKTFDRWAVAVDEGEEPQLLREFEPEKGILSIEQAEGNTIVKIEEGSSTTTIVSPGYYTLIEGPESQNYAGLEYPDLILESEDYVIVKEELLPVELERIDIIDDLEVAVDDALRDLKELGEEENVEKIDLADVTEQEAEDMKDDMGIDMPVDNSLNLLELNLFPNPNNGVFNLKFESQVEGDIEVRVYTADGRVIYNEVQNDFSGQFIEGINVEGNSKGVYFLMVRQGERTFSKKFIVQ